MMKRLHYFLLTVGLLCVAGMGGGCSEVSGMSEVSEVAQRERLVLTGSSTVAPMALEMAKRFEALAVNRARHVRIDVQTGGSSRGIADVRRGVADIGMVSRALKASEQELYAHPLARDGVCLIVHAANPVRHISAQQVRDIYTKKIVNWHAVGGDDAPITVVNKAAGRATLDVFLAYYALDNRDVQADVIIGDNEQGIKTLVGNPHALAYVSIGTAEYDLAHGIPLRLLPIEGVEASTANIAAGTFPLARPLNFITSAVPVAGSLQEAFIQFCQSAQVDDVIRAQSFVPLEHALSSTALSD